MVSPGSEACRRVALEGRRHHALGRVDALRSPVAPVRADCAKYAQTSKNVCGPLSRVAHCEQWEDNEGWICFLDVVPTCGERRYDPCGVHMRFGRVPVLAFARESVPLVVHL